MKTLNITKEAFEKSNYFTRKYGKLAFVSESGKLFKTNKGKVLKFAKESRKIVKEGAGAGYTVHIKGLRLGNMLDAKRVKDGDGYSYYKLTLEILPGEYEIGAEDYDNDFFWQAHEFGEKATAQIDGGVVDLDYTGIVHDEGDLEDLFREEIEGREFDIAFRYGWGWTHVYLPNDKPIKSDYIEIEGGDIYGDIDKIELNAPDLADAVNGGYESIFDQGEDSEEDDEEQFDESYEPNSDDGRKRVMVALEKFRNVLWEDTKAGDKEEHSLRKSLFHEADHKISQAVQKYFKYSRI